MSNKTENQKKIVSAFAAAQSRMDSTIISGMSALLDAGMMYCLEHHHDEGHNYHSHQEMKDSYGWILIHNGLEVTRKINPAPGLRGEDGREVIGHANDALTAIRGEVPSTGWVGIVLASIVPATYFQVKAEFKMMRLATKELKQANFNEYFERIAR